MGFLLFAQFTSERPFYPRVERHATAPAVRELGILTRDTIDALLRLVATDQARLKEESIWLSASGTGNDPYDWNVLFKYTAIDIAHANYVLIYRVEDAPFYELADLHQREGSENPFRAFFRAVFQDYVGPPTGRCVSFAGIARGRESTRGLASARAGRCASHRVQDVRIHHLHQVHQRVRPYGARSRTDRTGDD